jgi:hypothetical protein
MRHTKSASVGCEDKLFRGEYLSASGKSRCVALVRTDVSEEHSASIIRVTRIGEVG